MKNRRSNISDSVRKELEFDKVLSLLGGFAQSSANKERIPVSYTHLTLPTILLV